MQYNTVTPIFVVTHPYRPVTNKVSSLIPMPRKVFEKNPIPVCGMMVRFDYE
tara:strand:+ start:7349 stop:7504 length:156 start_codon:yes stop_codon:yes gene_type:complete